VCYPGDLTLEREYHGLSTTKIALKKKAGKTSFLEGFLMGKNPQSRNGTQLYFLLYKSRGGSN